MKTCPSCDRHYADNSLLYCLDDGASLSPAFNAQAAWGEPSARGIRAPRTEVLPTPPAPTQASPAVTVAATPGPEPLPEASAKNWPKRIALALVGVVVVVIVTVSVAPRIYSKIKRDSVTKKVLTNLNGNWEGTAIWISADHERRTVQLTINGDAVNVNYPSRQCSGRWEFISNDTATATFREHITVGADHCPDGNIVDATKTADGLVLGWHYVSSERLTASALLKRK